MIKVSPPDFESYFARCCLGTACAFFLAMLVWAQSLLLNKFVLQHDIILHLRWAMQFHTALQEGVLLPRWAAASHGGLGDPTFLYYQPLFYYLTSLLRIAGFAQTKAFVVAAMLPSVAAGAIVFCRMARTYPTARAMFGMAMVVTCPALFFLSTQYGAFPWVMATPFCILFALESVENRPDPIRMGIWLSLICLSHLLSGLMVIMCTGGARLIFRFPVRAALADNFRWLGGIVLGLGLASFFLYPAITQQNLITPSAWTSDPTLDWHPSFAFSTFTYLRYGARWFLIQWPLPIFVLSMCILVVAICRRSAASDGHGPGAVPAFRLALVALVGLAFSSELAYPLFAYVSPLQKLQWPYRFVILSTVLATIAFATAANFRPLGNIRRTWLQYGCLGALLLQLCFVLFFQWSLFAVGKPLPASEIIMKGEFGQPEYVVAQRGSDWRTYNKQGQLTGECSRLGVLCEVASRTSHSSTTHITSSRDVTVRLPVFAFPGWRLTVDGRRTPLIADQKTGLISVAISPGTHEVRTSWEGVPAERVGNWISIAALALVAACLFLRHPSVRRQAKANNRLATEPF